MKTQSPAATVDDAPAIVRIADADMAMAAGDAQAHGDGTSDADPTGAVALLRARAFEIGRAHV